MVSDVELGFSSDSALGDTGRKGPEPAVPQSSGAGEAPVDSAGGEGGPSGPGGGPGPDGAPGGEPDRGEETGGPSSDSAGLAGSEPVAGGLVWLGEARFPAQFTYEVLDLCDDSAAYVAANRRVLGPGEEATEEDLFDVVVFRAVAGAECDGPGGRRYIYMGNGWWSPAFETVSEAAEFGDERLAESAERRRGLSGGAPLGYGGRFSREFPLEARDEVVVLGDTVSVGDGVVRGLVHNLSRTLYARDVVVTARPAGSAEGLSWRWPLTVQPGERAPFEIEGWQAGADPAMVDLSVAAAMSADVNISRAIPLRGGGMGSYLEGSDWDGAYSPDYLAAVAELPPGSAYLIISASSLVVPDSHPELASQISSHTIDDLRVYVAFFDDGRVIDLVRLKAIGRVSYRNNDNTSLGAEAPHEQATPAPAQPTAHPPPSAPKQASWEHLHPVVVVGRTPDIEAGPTQRQVDGHLFARALSPAPVSPKRIHTNFLKEP